MGNQLRKGDLLGFISLHKKPIQSNVSRMSFISVNLLSLAEASRFLSIVCPGLDHFGFLKSGELAASTVVG
jgi:hypothetical protein